MLTVANLLLLFSNIVCYVIGSFESISYLKLLWHIIDS